MFVVLLSALVYFFLPVLARRVLWKNPNGTRLH
jgi:hypothetical protein